MSPYLFTAVLVLGLLVGSFLNVVIYRFNTGKSIAKGRSLCFVCGKTLAWYELVPVLSYLFLRGRCRGCGARISPQYIFVEIATAAAFVLASYKAMELYPSAAVLAFILIAGLLSLYIVVWVYDARHKVIPDAFSFGAAALALGLGLIELWMGGSLLIHLAAGLALFIFFFSFWFFSRGTWMGLGDAKLALSVGFALGMSQGIAAILFSFWIGAAVTLVIMLVQKMRGVQGIGMKSEVPFGPFIIAGFLISFIWGINTESLLSFLAL